MASMVAKDPAVSDNGSTTAYMVDLSLTPLGWAGQASASDAIKIVHEIKIKYQPCFLHLHPLAQNESPRFEVGFKRLYQALQFYKSAPMDKSLQDEIMFRINVKLSSEVEGSLSLPDPKTYSITDRTQPKIDRDKSYFSSYGRVSVHSDMGIMAAASQLADKIVLDVGSGSGIMSIFAAKAGAKQVFAVEKSSNAAALSRKIIESNGLEDKIQVIQGLVEDVELPCAEVDAIVSEWMGYCLYYEGMLKSVIRARDRFLKPGGRMLPKTAYLSVGGVSYEKFYKDVCAFSPLLDDLDLSVIRDRVFSKVKICQVPANKIVTDHFCLEEINLKSCPLENVDGLDLTYFSLHVDKEKVVHSSCVEIHGLVLWFEVHFDGPGDKPIIALSTKPMPKHSTHWHHSLLLLKNPVLLGLEEVLMGSIELHLLPVNERGIKIHLRLMSPRTEEQTYFLF